MSELHTTNAPADTTPAAWPRADRTAMLLRLVIVAGFLGGALYLLLAGHQVFAVLWTALASAHIGLGVRDYRRRRKQPIRADLGLIPD